MSVLRRSSPPLPWGVLMGLVGAVAPSALGQVCAETPPGPIPLGSPSGCDQCLNFLLPGGLDAHPTTRYTLISDLPERLLSTGVLYATIPVLPPDSTGNPNLAMRTQIASNGFSVIDDDFDVFLWHTSSPGDGSQPRRIVIYVRNDGTGTVQVTPEQVMITDGSINIMGATLATRVLEEDWDTPVSPRMLSPGQGDVVAYSKRFAASSNGSDTSANVNCFGRVRANVLNSDPATHPTNLAVYVIAIGSANVTQNKNLAEAQLGVGATSGDPFDLNSPPSGCANRRATGVYETFTWRNDSTTLDAATLPEEGVRFRLAMADLNTQTCPDGRQTADLVLRPGYVRPDTIGNYMTDYRVALRLINTDPDLYRFVDLRFGRTGNPVGLAWRIDTGPDAATDAEVDAGPVRTGWAGSTEPVLDRSFLESDGGGVAIGPCEERTVSIHFLILGNSSLPFDISVVPVAPTEYVVDNAEASCYVLGNWSVSGNDGFYGLDSLVSQGGTGQDRAVFVPPVLASGRYDVYAWWVAASNRATAAPYDVRHLAGTSCVLTNQTTAGSTWNLLGSFDFARGNGGRITLSDAVPASQYVSADAVRLTYVAPIEAIVDNADPNCTLVGTWPPSANPGYWGTNSLIHTGDGGASTATFRPDLPYPGRYRVSAWWVPSSNRATAAPYTIHHLIGSTTLTVNQADAGLASQWNTLGTFDFAPGTAGSVVLAANVPTWQYVTADAVRFELLDIADVAGDLDRDGDADSADFAVLAECLAGPGMPTPPAGCVPIDFAAADLDADGDVDLADHANLATDMAAP